MAPSCCHQRPAKKRAMFLGYDRHTLCCQPAARQRHCYIEMVLYLVAGAASKSDQGWTWLGIWDLVGWGVVWGQGGPGDSTRCKIELQRVSEPKRRASGLGEAVHHHHLLPQHAPPLGPCQQGCDSSQPANCAKGIGGEGQVRRRPPRRATSSKDVDGRKKLLMRWCGSTGKARSVRRASTWTSPATGCMVL